MKEVIPTLHDATHQLIPMIDADTSAFNDYMDGLRMPKTTPEERQLRKEKMQAGLKAAISIPLSTMRSGNTAWDALLEVARYGNPASKSDTQVAARSLETGIWGAYQNVLINMDGIDDVSFKTSILSDAEIIMSTAQEKCGQVLRILEEVG
jgi:glutamate formiminotransferase/formiminotetrahydrofolate cyclodeaminase